MVRLGTVELVERSFETLAPGSSATGFTSTLIPPTDDQVQRVVLTASAGAIRYRIDGDDPTSTVGHELADLGSTIIIGQKAMTNFRCIESDSGAGCKLACSFLGSGKS